MDPEQALCKSYIDELVGSGFDISMPFDAWDFLCKKIRSELNKRYPNKDFKELTEVESRLTHARYMCHVATNFRELYKSIITGYPGFTFPNEARQMLLMSENMLSRCREPLSNQLVDYEDDDDENTESTIEGSLDLNNSSCIDSGLNVNNIQNFCQSLNSCDNNNNKDDGQQVENYEEDTRYHDDDDDDAPLFRKESIDTRPLFINPEPPRKVIKRENKEIVVQFSQVVPSPPPYHTPEVTSLSSFTDALSSSSLPEYQGSCQMNGDVVNGQQQKLPVITTEFQPNHQQQLDNPIHNEETNPSGIRQESEPPVPHSNSNTMQVSSTSSSNNILNVKIEYCPNLPQSTKKPMIHNKRLRVEEKFWKTPPKIYQIKLTPTEKAARNFDRNQRVIQSKRSASNNFVLLKCTRIRGLYDPRLHDAGNQDGPHDVVDTADAGDVMIVNGD